MALEVKRYCEAYQQEWDDFVKSSVNGTLMQERKFLNYHPPQRFADHSLIFIENEKLIAVLPAAEVQQENCKRLVSHPGASHGGIIIDPDLSTKKTLELVNIFVEYCCGMGFKYLRIKPVPRIYHRALADQLDFALRYIGFKVEYTELATALDLQANPEAIIKEAMSPTAYRNYKKAQNYGLKIVEDGDISAYWPILIKKLKDSHNATPTHTLEEILYLKKLYPEKILLFAAFKDKEMVAGVLTFLLNEQAINCFYIAHDQDYQNMRPLNLVFGYLMEWGQKKGFKYLDWGISTEAKGTRINSELFRFKEGFGGHGVLRESYEVSLL